MNIERFEMKKERKITLIDLFAGAGGFSCAARLCGLQILAAVENDIHAAETYRNNFIVHHKPQPLLFAEDINKLSPEKVMTDIRKKFNISSVDIVVGGPPCQGFSKHRHKDSGVDDPRNALLIRYFEYIHTINPKFFVVENVGGLLAPRHSIYLNRFYELAEQNGYMLRPPVILDAKNYGVPQTRKRVFILGYRKDMILSDGFQWPPVQTNFSPNSEAVLKEGKCSWANAQIVFDIPNWPDDINNRHMNHTSEMINVFQSTPINGGSRSESNRILPCHMTHNGHKDVYGRICVDKPGPTMTTGCVNPSKGRFLHPFETHGITVRQAARFQTFPDSFIFYGGIMSAAKQVGNAVPVKLAELIISQIKLELFRKDNGGQYD